MRDASSDPYGSQPSPLRHLLAALSALALGLVVLGGIAAPASAAGGYENVQHFAPLNIPASPPTTEDEFPEDAQLGGVSAMAVNRTGAGGVQPGTLYTIGQHASNYHLARYSPQGEFELAWAYGGVFPRCGPKANEPLHPNCKPQVAGAAATTDIDINQTTGDVYIFQPHGGVDNVLSVFRADGTGPIAEFGGPAAPNGTIAATPANFHFTYEGESIAVNDAGTVYVNDVVFASEFTQRLMIFKPKTPGVYTDYEYAGEIATRSSDQPGLGHPVLDDAGNIYTLSGEGIEEISPTGTALCKFAESKGGITSITVNPATGEVFYYDPKPSDRKIHQLAPCQGGQLAPVPGADTGLAPVRSEVTAMTINPSLKWDSERPAGVLYAGSSSDCPTLGSCPATSVGLGPLGYILAPPVSHEPVVESQSVSKAGPSGATLNALINPKGALTTYVFQYMTEAAFLQAGETFAGATEAPLGGASVGSGQQPLPASVALSGLVPDTAYRYRVTATSAEGTDQGLAKTFRTFPVEAPGLPDERAWELVSPTQKNGGEVIPAYPTLASCGGACKPGTIADRFPVQSSTDGESLVYEGFPFSFTEGAAVWNQYLSTRTATGWQTANLSPSLMGSGGSRGYKAFDPKLSQGLLSQFDPGLSPAAPDGFANLYAQPTGDPASLTPLLLTDPPNRSTGGPDSFDLAYVGASEDLSRVFFRANDALTQSTTLAPAAENGGPSKYNLYESAAGQLRLVNVLPGNTVSAAGGPIFPSPSSHAISADGSRVFWSDESGQVYVRENGESTTAIPDPAKFLSASTDGSQVLLADGHLYDLETKVLTDLTEGQGGFLGLSGQSDDLSHVYFVATTVLDGTPNQFGVTAQSGKPNLYNWHGGAASYIATLLPTDTTTDSAGVAAKTWNSSPADRSAEASPDGRWLAFLSKGSLTGYDNHGACEPENGKGYLRTADCTEVFLFDSTAGSLLCASCNPSGQAPIGPSFLRLVQSSPVDLLQPRYLSDSGRLVFDSADSLSPFDTNDGVEDVYQYEPDGVGSCLRQAGCISLVSAGREPVDSNFLAMDPSGKNVFFTTRDQLVLKDTDELIDVYVAREDGGIAAETEVPSSGCQGEACLPSSVPPEDQPLSSSAFKGPGNVTEPPAAKCSKGKVRKKGRCVKKHNTKKRANRNRGGSK
jgi:hypothetical protein